MVVLVGGWYRFIAGLGYVMVVIWMVGLAVFAALGLDFGMAF